MLTCRFKQTALVAGLGLALLGAASLGPFPGQPELSSVIIQDRDLPSVTAAVQSVGGEITHTLGVINAVAAQLTTDQIVEIRALKGSVRIYDNVDARVSGGPIPDAAQRSLVGADLLFDEGIDGTGVTVAVLDTGIWYSYNDLKNDLDGHNRIAAEYNAIKGKEEHSKDETGHGTHVTTIISGTKISDNHNPHGIAPNVDLVNVMAFGRDGSGSYADIIRGIDWVIDNKDALNIRVLNLSFSAAPRSFYWNDPLNQAVMSAWQAGIVVVASAGNTGPGAMTIGVPGNVPYVITVGAMTDNFTPDDPTDDRLATFSSAGPTAEGFIKRNYSPRGDI